MTRSLEECESRYLSVLVKTRNDPRGKNSIAEMELAIECAVLARSEAIKNGNGNFSCVNYFYNQLRINHSAAIMVTAEINRRKLFAMDPDEARALIVATAQARLGKMLKLQVSATGKPILDPRKPIDAPDPYLYEYDDTAATRWARELARSTGSDAPVKTEVTVVSVADELKRRIARLERGSADAVVISGSAAIEGGDPPLGLMPAVGLSDQASAPQGDGVSDGLGGAQVLLRGSDGAIQADAMDTIERVQVHGTHGTQKNDVSRGSQKNASAVCDDKPSWWVDALG